MAEMFTLQRLKLPPSLYKCLATTNVIESPQSGDSRRTGNVPRWRDQEMVERWDALQNFQANKRMLACHAHKPLGGTR